MGVSCFAHAEESGIDEVERLAIEREVQEHLRQVEELGEILRQLEEEMPHAADPARHRHLKQEITFIRADIRGRMVAIAVGEGRLGVDSWPGPETGEP